MILGIASLGRIGGCGGRDAKWWFVPTGFYSQFDVFNWKFSLKFQVDQFQQVHICQIFPCNYQVNQVGQVTEGNKEQESASGEEETQVWKRKSSILRSIIFIFSGVKGFKWAEKMPKNCQSPIQNKMTCDCFDCYNTACFEQKLTIMWYSYYLNKLIL